MITFEIEGKPTAKERPYFSSKGGKFRVFTPSTTARFENLVKIKASPLFSQPLMGPVSISIFFYLPRPKYLVWKNKPMPFLYSDKRPDIDNLTKSVIDGLNGIAFHDDAQISRLEVEKGYHAGNEGPRTVVKVNQLSSDE
jgi:Holliday junction resolvase RusA-like endonuclease